MSDAVIIKVNGKPIGSVIDGVFIKHVSSKKHFLRQPPAIGFEVSSLKDAMDAGAKEVLIIDKDTGDEYRASIQYIINWGMEIDRGWGIQIALPIRKWSKMPKAQMGLFDE